MWRDSDVCLAEAICNVSAKAEAMCEAMGSKSVRLRIVNLREELGRWYKSLG